MAAGLYQRMPISIENIRSTRPEVVFKGTFRKHATNLQNYIHAEVKFLEKRCFENMQQI